MTNIGSVNKSDARIVYVDVQAAIDSEDIDYSSMVVLRVNGRTLRTMTYGQAARIGLVTEGSYK